MTKLDDYGEKGLSVYLQERHRLIFKHLISHCPFSLDTANVLDIGCLEGEFFKVLCDQFQIGRSFGLDISKNVIDAANSVNTNRLVELKWIERGASLAEATEHLLFDVAFSHEVIYQIEDLAQHAKNVLETLKPSGVYIACTGCHLESPLWVLWKKLRDEDGTSRTHPHFDYFPSDFSKSFHAAGFREVEIVPFDWTPPPNFELIPSDSKRSRYWPSEHAAKEFYKKNKLVIICRR